MNINLQTNDTRRGFEKFHLLSTSGKAFYHPPPQILVVLGGGL